MSGSAWTTFATLPPGSTRGTDRPRRIPARGVRAGS
jgi:hypothetical protein